MVYIAHENKSEDDTIGDVCKFIGMILLYDSFTSFSCISNILISSVLCALIFF